MPGALSLGGEGDPSRGAGATSFRADSLIAKTRRDLNGLLYADGIHNSLYRATGKHHTAAPHVATRQPDERSEFLKPACCNRRRAPPGISQFGL